MNAANPYDTNSKTANTKSTQESKKNESTDESLRERSEKYTALFQSANSAIFIMDEDRFIDFNPKTLEIFRCTAEERSQHEPWGCSPE